MFVFKFFKKLKYFKLKRKEKIFTFCGLRGTNRDSSISSFRWWCSENRMDDCVSFILIEKLIESVLIAVGAAESCWSMFVDVVVVVVVGAVLFDATPCIIITCLFNANKYCSKSKFLYFKFSYFAFLTFRIAMAPDRWSICFSSQSCKQSYYRVELVND